VKILAGIAVFAFFGLGCNPLSVVDPPFGDSQILSKARGCFDRGDFVCATQYYAKLSGGAGDTGNSESAFELLAQYGVTSTVLMTAVTGGGSSGGKIITSLGGTLTTAAPAGQTARLAFFHAYQKSLVIADPKTKGLIRFLTALALTSELLAENARTSGKIKQTDLVVDPTTCAASAPLYISAGCAAPTGGTLITGTTVTLTTATDTDMSGTPTLYMINAAIGEISAGLSQMGSSSSLGSSSSAFSSALIAIALVPGTDSPAYRATLVGNGIGEE